ncbi:MAG: hypothetical protein ACRDWA_14010 [Acidimicrobiia bacterium]
MGEEIDKTAIFGARQSTTTAIVVSGVRCAITYLLIPIMAPVIGLASAVGGPLSIVLSAVALVMAVVGVRRFWIADHPARWSYTTFIGVVVVLLCVAIVSDLKTIFFD